MRLISEILQYFLQLYCECMWSGMIDRSEVTATVVNEEEGATLAHAFIYMINDYLSVIPNTEWNQGYLLIFKTVE